MLFRSVMEGRKLERSLRWAFTFSIILAAGLPLYWLLEPNRQSAATSGFEERAVERGEVLFSNKDMPKYDPTKSLLCANCHGADAAGGQAPFVVTPAAQGDENARPIQVAWKAPALNNVFSRFDDEQVHTILVYGRPGSPMPAWGVAGGGPKNEQAITDLIAGRVQIMFEGMNSMAPHVKSGKLRGIAVTTQKRVGAFPDIPTMTESGVPGFDLSAWQGMVAPAGLPRPLLDRINGAVNRAISGQNFKTRMIELGNEVAGGTPEEFAALIRRDSARWGEVIRKAGIKED